MSSTRKIRTPSDLIAYFQSSKSTQNFFKDLENRDLLGEIYANESSTFTANSVTVTDGTITSGDVDSTKTINAVYLVVNETGSYTIDYSFTSLSGDPARVEFHGRYQGSIGHTVTAKFYNFNTTVWDNAVAGGKDFPSSTSDYAVTFDYPADSSDYIENGESRFRIEHISAPNAAHNFYTDYIATLVKTAVLPDAGTFYKITGLENGCQNRTITDGTNGTITAQTVGWYSVNMTVSFFGATAKYQGHVFVNDVLQDNLGASRAIGSGGDVGSAGISGCVVLNDGDVVDVRVTSTSDDVFIGLEHFNLMIRAIN